MRVALIDLSWCFRRHWHAQGEDAEISAAPRATITELSRYREQYDHCILCLDAPPYFRKNLEPEYKAHRERPSDGFRQQAKWLKERLDADGWQMARADTFEADDVIATLAKAYGDDGHEVSMIASDKDIAQCVVGSTCMVVPGRDEDEVRDAKGVVLKYGVPPEKMALWLALTGDKSDNVKGVPGIGAKTAAKLINEHGDFQGIASALADKAGEKKVPALWKALADNWEQVRKSLELVKLRTDAPVDAATLLGTKEVRRLVEYEDEDTLQGSEPPEVDGEPVAEPKKARPRSEPPPPRQIVRVSSEFSEQLQPASFTEAQQVAKWLKNSRLYDKFPTAEAIFAVLLRGRELGIGATTALDNFHVIQGRPCASAHLIAALAQKHPDCEYLMLVESSATKATYETKHRKHPKPTSLTWTIEEAQQTDTFKKNPNWRTRPAQMLRKECVVQLVRAVYQEAACGLYTPEEAGSVDTYGDDEEESAA